jgi:hypothetical protein
MLRRRQILLDESGNTVLPSLGKYLPPGQTSVQTIAQAITPSQAIKVPTLPINPIISLTKSLPMSQLQPITVPTDPRIVNQIQRLAAAADRSPSMLDRMKAIPTAVISKTYDQKLIPNTTGDRLASIAQQIKTHLSSKLPNISLGQITALLSKMKMPIIAALGIAAVAAIVYAGYSIYKRVTTVGDTRPVEKHEAPREPIASVESDAVPKMEVATPHIVYDEDILDIVRGIEARRPLTNAQKVSIITRIRGIAETTDDAAEFVSKVAEVEKSYV